MTDQPEPWAELLREIDARWPVARWRHLGVVVGCSGGADSVALVSALASLRQQPLEGDRSPPRGFLVVAHFNHRLRGSDSDDDQAFTAHLAQQLELPFRLGSAPSPVTDEASMRRQRMRFLIDAAHTLGARYIALAHSADDNAETVLHHLMRGTGPAGLAGIGSPRSIGEDLVLVRPLLHYRRQHIRRALRSRQQAWREDASNLDPSYRRNWIRHRLIPLMESEYPQAVEAIVRAIDGQRQWRQIMDRLAASWLETHQIPSIGVQTLRRDPSLEPALAIAAAQQLWKRLDWPRGAMTQTHWLRLAEILASAEPARLTLPAGVEVIASGTDLTLSRRDPEPPGENDDSGENDEQGENDEPDEKPPGSPPS